MLPPHDKIESRTWDTQYRGWVLLHAAKEDYKSFQIENISGPDIASSILDIVKDFGLDIYKSRGKAFAVGYLERVIPMANLAVCDHERTFVLPHNDLFAWEFSEVHPIKPIALKGKQGWGTVSEETIQKIEIVEKFMAA